MGEDLKCSLWNCSGIVSSNSTQEKIDFLFNTANNDFDILVLVETHHKLVQDIQSSLLTRSNAYHFLHTGAEEGDAYAGIIVLVNKNFEITDEQALLPGRILSFKLRSKNRTYKVSAIYGYTGKQSNTD